MTGKSTYTVAAQYNGIYHDGERNEAIELHMRSSDKSICGLIDF
jgi:hypothetical protein